VSDFLAIIQLYHGENKLHLDVMMMMIMMSTLYYTNALIFIALAY